MKAKAIRKAPCKRCGSRSYRYAKRKDISYCTVCGLETNPRKIAGK